MKIIILLLYLIPGLVFTSCSDTTRIKGLDNWLGNYRYEEEPVEANAGSSMVMEWTFSINKKNDSCQGILEINGRQTYIKLLTNISGDSNNIAVTYNKLIDGSDENLSNGDTLFILSKKAGELKTNWQVLEPRLSENRKEECSCFIEVKL